MHHCQEKKRTAKRQEVKPQEKTFLYRVYREYKVSINLCKDFVLFPRRKQNMKPTNRKTPNRANQNQFQIWKSIWRESDPGGKFETNRT